MQEFHNHRQPSGFRKYRSLIVALAVMLVGGAGFAATGGTETVKRLFVTLRLVGSDGETTYDVLLENVGDGPVSFELGDGQEATGMVMIEASPAGVGSGEEGEVVQVIFERAAVGDEPVSMKAQLNDGGFTGVGLARRRVGDTEGLADESITISVARAGDDGAQQLSLIRLQSLNSKGLAERIEDTEPVGTWDANDGRTRELFILPFENENERVAGFQIVTVTRGGEPDWVAQLSGHVSGMHPATTDIEDIVWEGDVATIIFLKEDGSQVTADILTSDEALDSGRQPRLILSDESGGLHSPILNRVRD